MQLRILVLFTLLLGVNLSVKSQPVLKIGHVNIQELVENHPDTDSIHAVLEQEAKDMEDVYAGMLEEQQQKLDAFEAESAGYSEFVKKTKQDELLQLSRKIEAFNQNADQQLRQRNMALLQPVYNEINAAIKEVSSENDFTYVLDISSGTVAYISPDSEDITARVLDKLRSK